MPLHTQAGERKYLTPAERRAVLAALDRAPREVRTFGGLLVHTGCRISEALAVTVARVDFADGAIVLESLKRRERGVFRAVPVPPAYLDVLDLVHNVRSQQRLRGRGADVRLWPWSRGTGWARVRAVMQDAGLTGRHATPHGLRHAFGIQAVTAGVPLNLVQRWLGHAQLSTTAMYADALGEEARVVAQRMWT